MRAPDKKKTGKIKQIPVSIDSSLVKIAVESAKEAAKSAKDTAELARIALDSDNHEEMRKVLEQMSEAIKVMARALDKKFNPIRVVPKRDHNGVAVHYDVLPLTKKVH